MKNILCVLFYFTAILNAIAQHPTCDGNRYKNNVFASIDSVKNIQFGQNYTMNNVLQNLYMDIYQPGSDVAPKRPLIIFIHGGGFFMGDRTKDVKFLCDSFAHRGFVTATIDYRLIDVPIVDSATVAEGNIMAMGDAKAAIRFFVEDAATANIYKIDTNYIFIGGASAGGFTASQAAYLDPTDNIPLYIMNMITAHGGFPGNSSTNTSHSAPIKGVLNYSGALWRKDWISPGEPVLFSAHDNLDQVVPCGYGLSTGVFSFPVYIYGSCAMQQEAGLKGVYNDMYLNNSSGHYLYFYTPGVRDTALQKTAGFLYDILCTNVVSTFDQEQGGSIVQLYPNPATEFLTVAIPESKETNLPAGRRVQVLNSMGILMKEMETLRITQLDIADLPNGLYFIHIKNRSLKTQKFVKQ